MVPIIYNTNILLCITLIQLLIYANKYHSRVFLTFSQINTFCFSFNEQIPFVPENSLILFASKTWFDAFDENSCSNDPRFDVKKYRLSSSYPHDFNNAKVVIFHPNDFDFKLLPKNRPKGQLWVWLNVEPPKNVGYKIYEANGHFNYTATYKTDSDIYLPYAYFIEKPNFTFSSKYFKPFEERNKLSCWLVSNMRSTFRNRYINELKKYMEVDVLTGPIKRTLRNKCDYISQCKFYLAFENSNNSDYITEKIWYNSFQCGAIPIVRGTVKSDYLKQKIPSDSFIHADDFSNPEELAKYIHTVENNRTLYESYFNWRKGRDIYFEDRFGTFYCRVVDYIGKYNPKPHEDHLTANWFLKNYDLNDPNT